MAQMVKEAQVMATASHVPMIVVFIHGFNNDPDAALASTSLAGPGLAANDVKPLMICFDWASNHEVWRYLTDEGDAARTVPAVMKMLDFLHTYRDPASCPVNVIAHSMGNFFLMRSLKAFADRLGNPAFFPTRRPLGRGGGGRVRTARSGFLKRPPRVFAPSALPCGYSHPRRKGNLHGDAISNARPCAPEY